MWFLCFGRKRHYKEKEAVRVVQADGNRENSEKITSSLRIPSLQNGIRAVDQQISPGATTGYKEPTVPDRIVPGKSPPQYIITGDDRKVSPEIKWAENDNRDNITPASTIGTIREANQEIEYKFKRRRDSETSEEAARSRADMIASIHNIFRPGNNKKNHPQKLIYDVYALNPQKSSQLRRRLLLDFQGHGNFIADDIPESLELKIEPVSGAFRTAPRDSGIQPKGQITMCWSIVDAPKIYKTDFLVVTNTDYDILLGRDSIIAHELFRRKSKVATLLKA